MSGFSSKGLANQPGENNCFLNCAVQALWHIDVFRESLRQLSGHRCTGMACIFCALKVTFTQLSYSGQQTLVPNILRKALAESFSTEQRFQLGDMDDAAECLETILQRLHLHLCEEVGDVTCEAPHCISHSKFGMRILEAPTCPNCKGNGGRSLPSGGERYVQLIHYVATDALVSQLRNMRSGSMTHDGTDGGFQPNAFSHLLRKAANVGDVRECQACGNASARLQRHLLSPSSVLILGLVWHSQQPSVTFLADVVESIGTELHPDLLFDRGPQNVETEHDNAGRTQLQLTALICYYSRHYSAFCRQESGVWLFFDDDLVRPIGPLWRTVVHRCVRGGFQPLLLLYTDPTASPVDVAGALAVTCRVSVDQFRQEAAASTMSTSSGSLGRSRTCLSASSEAVAGVFPPDAEVNTGMAPGCDTLASQHSRSSSLSEDTLLAGGNPHPHRRAISVSTPPPPPQFANDQETELMPVVKAFNNGTATTALEFRRQGSYISAVTDRPSGLPSVKRADSVDSTHQSPPVSPTTRTSSGSSPVHRSLSCAASSPDSSTYIKRQTVETVLQIQRQEAAQRRRAATGDAAAPSANRTDSWSSSTSSAVSCSGTLPKRRPLGPPPMPPPRPVAVPTRQADEQATSTSTIPRQPMRARALPAGVDETNQAGRLWQFQKARQAQGQGESQRPDPGHRPPPQQMVPAGQLQHGQQPRQPVPPSKPPDVSFQRKFPNGPPGDLRNLQQQSQIQHLKAPVENHSNRTPFNPSSVPHPNQSRNVVTASQPHLLPVVSQAKESSQQQGNSTPRKIVDGACPKCGVVDSWTMDAGICIRCNQKLPPRSAPPLKPALVSVSGRTASISSADSSTTPSITETDLSASDDAGRRPRKKKSVHFNEATIAPMDHHMHRQTSYSNFSNDGWEPCQLCQQNPVDRGGPAYCSACEVYLSRFVSQAR